MSQGKKYNKDEILESLKPYFQLGYSIPDACDFVGIDNSTLYKWIKEDDTLSKKIKGWQNEISVLARQNWRKEISEKKNYEASKEWLKKKDRKEFGDNMDLTTDGNEINLSEITVKIVDGSLTDEKNE